MIPGILRNFPLIGDFILREIRIRYGATLLGPLWIVLPQIIVVATYWFVFEHGLRIKATADIPFFQYFIPGILPWFLFSETVTASLDSVREVKHYITKMVFPSEIVCVVKFSVASLPHLVSLSIAVCLISVWSGSEYRLIFLPYFYFCTAVLALGIAWLISAMNVFTRDLAPAAQLVIGLLFWATPILWSRQVFPESWQWAIDWNPISYIVDGYRWALLGTPPPSLEAAFIFWGLASGILAAGLYTFSRLKPHFADVL